MRLTVFEFWSLKCERSANERCHGIFNSQCSMIVVDKCVLRVNYIFMSGFVDALLIPVYVYLRTHACCCCINGTHELNSFEFDIFRVRIFPVMINFDEFLIYGFGYAQLHANYYIRSFPLTLLNFILKLLLNAGMLDL